MFLCVIGNPRRLTVWGRKEGDGGGGSGATRLANAYGCLIWLIFARGYICKTQFTTHSPPPCLWMFNLINFCAWVN